MIGYLFDLYHLEDKITIWILDEFGKMHSFTDHYHPEIFLRGNEDMVKKVLQKLHELKAIRESPRIVRKKDFYTFQDVEALSVRITKPNVLKKITRKLYSFYEQLEIYHTDIDLLSSYLYYKNLFPLCRVEVISKSEKIIYIEPLDSILEKDYSIPEFNFLYIQYAGSPRLGLQKKNPLLVQSGKRAYELFSTDHARLLKKINAILEIEDPDVILSSYGDQFIFPYLFQIAQNTGIPLQLDRDTRMKIVRKILTKGTSFNTYGQWIFRAPAYPLFGRWHIDRVNSFVYKESNLDGILELARMSRMPVQRLARSSTGAALTNIETFVALEKNYLIPWQKSALENPKTAYELLRIDKGGLVFQPSISVSQVHENVVQIDFSQMYPSVMVLHNISPETVNCNCCSRENSPGVPFTNYHICKKRRGIVSLALKNVLERRSFFKSQSKNKENPRWESFQLRQECIKWMLVTSFGYLGYRNAKFGKLESHESVTAFGREKILTAKEISESHGYSILHGITDCLFLSKGGEVFYDEELQVLTHEIFQKTQVGMNVESIYSWVVFPASKVDDLMPVVNRYYGRLRDGSMKYRGLFLRRKDIPVYVKHIQSQILTIMSSAQNISQVKALHPKIEELYYESIVNLKNVPWTDLLIRRSVSKNLDEYEVDTATALSMRELKDLEMEVVPGEKVRFLVLSQNNSNKKLRYISEEKLQTSNQDFEPDKEYYSKLIRDAFLEVWKPFAPSYFFSEIEMGQQEFRKISPVWESAYTTL